ncbi:hypothetical protein ACNKHW_18220 [Shigella flexneri]
MQERKNSAEVKSIAAIEELASCDVLIIGAPMINHSVSSGCKNLDHPGLSGWFNVSFYFRWCRWVTNR